DAPMAYLHVFELGGNVIAVVADTAVIDETVLHRLARLRITDDRQVDQQAAQVAVPQGNRRASGVLQVTGPACLVRAPIVDAHGLLLREHGLAQRALRQGTVIGARE